jgi:membrane-bound serine protease (ClpP class)
MDFLLNPNIAYMFLMAGVLLTLLSIVTPGTGVLEVGAFFCLAMVGYAVYNLSFNLWALIVMAVSIAPFLYSLRKPKRELWLGLSLLGLVAGSIFLFSREDGLPAVNLLVALTVSSLIMAFLWVAVGKSIRVMLERPTHDLGALIGQVGEARTQVGAEGSVQVNGELWSARSSQPISAGCPVRVVNREGFILVGEEIARQN